VRGYRHSQLLWGVENTKLIFPSWIKWDRVSPELILVMTGVYTQLTLGKPSFPLFFLLSKTLGRKLVLAANSIYILYVCMYVCNDIPDLYSALIRANVPFKGFTITKERSESLSAAYVHGEVIPQGGCSKCKMALPVLSPGFRLF
jgi:hypothetical protein